MLGFVPSTRPTINVADEPSSPSLGTSSRSSRLCTLKSCRSSWSRADKRKIIVKDFLETNGFLHVNEAKRSWGQTSYPLHCAVHQKKAVIVKALLLLGARPDVKYRGYTPEEYAKRKHRRWGGYDDVLKVFVETMPKISTQSEDCGSSENSTDIPEDF